jgi:hypothetical protein
VFRHEPGRSQVYRLEYRSDTSVDWAALVAAQGSPDRAATQALTRRVEVELRGLLVSTILDRETDGTIVLALSFDLSDLRIRSDEQPAHTALLQARLAEPTCITARSSGQIRNLRLGPAMPQVGRDLVRGILAAIQVVLPKAATQEWTTEEEEPSGVYRARYSAVSEDRTGLIRIEKTKQEYLQPTTRRGRHWVRSAARVLAVFDPRQGLTARLDGSEQREDLLGQRPFSSTRVMVRLTHAETRSLAAKDHGAARDRCSALEHSEPFPLYSSKEDSTRQLSLQHKELGRDTVESVLAQLHALDSAPDGGGDETSVYLKVRALAMVHPETCARLGDTVARGDPRGRSVRAIVQALSVAGNAAAQDALVQALRLKTRDPEASILISTALGETASPTFQAERALRELATTARDQNVAAAAQLSLGAMAQRLAEKAPERAQRLVRSLLDQLRAARTGSARRQLLLVLGNSGAPEAAPAVLEFLLEPSAELRATAVWALRFQPSGPIDSILARALASDPDTSVRVSAARAFGFRQVTAASFEACEKALRGDPAEEVRLAALQPLWNTRDHFPAALRSVQEAVLKDASKRVREAAAGLVPPSPRTPPRSQDP